MSALPSRRSGCSGCLKGLVALVVLFLFARPVLGIVFQGSSPADLPAASGAISQLFGGGLPNDAQYDDWRFNADLRPYYAELDEDEQREYRNIVNCLLAGESSVDFEESLSKDQAGAVMLAIEYDQPDIFWYTQYVMDVVDDRVDSIAIAPLFESEELDQKRAQLDAAVRGIADPLAGLSALDQEKAAFEAIVGLCTDDGSGGDGGQGAYAALVEGKAVCAGYSRALQQVLLTLNIPCYYVAGDAQGQDYLGTGWGSHAWNIVGVDGSFYNVDITWADYGVMGGSGVFYRYFDVSDEDMSSDHVRSSESQVLPECASSFDFQGRFGVDRAVASLKSAGYDPDCVATTSDDYMSGVFARASVEGVDGLTFVSVVQNTDEASIDSMHSAALDSLLCFVPPGEGVSISGTLQQYSPGTFLLVDRFALE